MPLPALRPESDIGKHSPLQLATPPATSSPPPSYKPVRDGPLEPWTSPHHPARGLYDHILHAQEIAEDKRIRLSELRVQQEGQEHSCPKDSETTPWLKHTEWPQRFCNRPLDIITASTRLPVRGTYIYKEDLVLGKWRGELLRSTAASEARMRVLIHAVDDMFNRAEDTLACTPYQSRCWLTSYQQRVFRHRPLPRGYKSKWKKFIYYIFRAFEMSPLLRRDIHNVPLRGDDMQMMRHILILASKMVRAREKGDQATGESGEPHDCENSDDEEEEDSQSYSGSDLDNQSESDSEIDSNSDYTDDRSDN
ncbi:hypothetical protein BGZ63DRAFT_367553, partial [Mariannaea sp. PMI_226]